MVLHHIGSISVIYISNILNAFMVNMSRFDSEIYAYDLFDRDIES